MELELDLAVTVLLRHLLDWLRLLHLAAYPIPCIWLGSMKLQQRHGAPIGSCPVWLHSHWPRGVFVDMVCRFFQGTFCVQFLFGHG